MTKERHYILYLDSDMYYPLGEKAAGEVRGFMHNNRQGEAITVATLFNDQIVEIMRSKIICLEETRPDIRETERDYQEKLQAEGPGFE